MTKLTDRFLLIGVALLICLVGIGSVILGDIYHVNPAWFFFGWNSLFLLPMLWREFRDHLRKPAFIVFFVVWMCAHGLTVLALMRWAPLTLWPFAILLELALGFLAAHYLFGFSLQPRSHEAGGR